MNKGKYVFAQLLDIIDKDVFLRIANKYDGNSYVKQFTCWNQLAVLMFGQLSNRESLRDGPCNPGSRVEGVSPWIW